MNEFLHKFWKSYVNCELSLLELGCNSGSNLETLRLLGYKRLAGLEINSTAVELMSRVFPDLYKDVTLKIGSLEDTLPLLPMDSCDVVFTMAVLMHVHPNSNGIFSEIIRVARKYVVTVEPEFANCGYVFSRNYRRLFQRLGCTQLSSMKIGIDATAADIADYHGVILRILSVPNSGSEGSYSSA